MILLYEGLDWGRMLIGDTPPMLLLEIFIRTVIMYVYTVLLIRFLGKRGMGQFSLLELVIIISFGTAVGDPMMIPEVPLLHGMLVITVITLVQIGMEWVINRNRKIERAVEGEEDILIRNGKIDLEEMKENNISHTDLMRALRKKDVEHLGQVKLAVFETSGEVTVFFKSPRNVRPGLSTVPKDQVAKEKIKVAGERITETSNYSCLNCGETVAFKSGGVFPPCPDCMCEEWMEAEGS